MFQEEGNAFIRFVRPQGHTQCIQLTETLLAYKKTPQWSFNC